MSFILDALRKSENERQQAAVPGISDVPAVVHRNKVPAWMLGVIAGLTACVVVMGWAWIEGIGSPDRASAASMSTEMERVDSAEVADPPSAMPAAVRSLAREAQQPAPDETPTAAAPPPAAQVVNTQSLLTVDQLLSSGADLPELNLELHVFSASPADRFVFINSSKYLEGESLPEGPRIVAITEEGVVMSHRNQPFLLPRE